MMALVLLPQLAFADAPNPQIDRLWRGKCGSCHGADGKAQTEQAKKMAIHDMTIPDWQKANSDAQIKAAISGGVKRTQAGVAQEMEPYKDKLRPDQIDGLIAYIRGLKK